MDPTFILNWLMRWLHIVSAVAGIGATLMMRFAVLPALARMPNGDEVLAQIRPGFKRLIHAALGTALLTGFQASEGVEVALESADETGFVATATHPAGARDFRWDSSADPPLSSVVR